MQGTEKNQPERVLSKETLGLVHQCSASKAFDVEEIETFHTFIQQHIRSNKNDHKNKLPSNINIDHKNPPSPVLIMDPFDPSHKCEICNMTDRYKDDLNLQKCKDCGIYIHEKCYGLEHKHFQHRNIIKYQGWKCHACSAVGKTIKIEKNNKVTEVHIDKRPMKCALCPVKTKITAMYPLYDKSGPDGQPLLKLNETLWVHSICAHALNQIGIGGELIYGCTESGDYLGADEEEYEDMIKFDSSAENKKKDEIFRIFPHHFVITSRADGAVDSSIQKLKELRHLKCFICKHDDRICKRIVAQCCDYDCATACHIGCAKWGSRPGENLLRFDSDFNSALFCRKHCKKSVYNENNINDIKSSYSSMDHSNNQHIIDESRNDEERRSFESRSKCKPPEEAVQVNMKPISPSYKKRKDFEQKMFSNILKDLMLKINTTDCWRAFENEKKKILTYYQNYSQLTKHQLQTIWHQCDDEVMIYAIRKFEGTESNEEFFFEDFSSEQEDQGFLSPTTNAMISDNNRLFLKNKPNKKENNLSLCVIVNKKEKELMNSIRSKRKYLSADNDHGFGGNAAGNDATTTATATAVAPNHYHTTTTTTQECAATPVQKKRQLQTLLDTIEKFNSRK
jgi:hypothetical protein